MDKIKCEWSSGYDYGYYRKYGLRYLKQDFDLVKLDNGDIVKKEVWRDIGYFSNYINSKQGGELTKEEVNFFLNKLPKYYRDEILAWSPVDNKKKYKGKR